MKILVLNAGSSSHKAALFDFSVGQEPLWRSQLDWTHRAGAVELEAEAADGREHQATLETQDKTEGIRWMLDTLVDSPVQILQDLSEIQAIGHRVVHGGRDYQQSTQITPAVKEAIKQLFPLAPSHNPANLQGIEAMEAILPLVSQVAVFDTAFHSQMPAAASTYPGPYDWVKQGIQRYGFHGISHRYVAQRAAELMHRDLADLKIITCHLGNGCSLAAVRNGVSADTTMGFTPLDGLMMGSRSGSVDPGIVIYLARHDHLSADELDTLLNKASGLKGISGVSNDMRQVREAADSGSDRAQLAYDMFIHSLRRNIGAMLGNLGGLDALVFTAGIGENSPDIWQATCQNWDFLELSLNEETLHRSKTDQDIATLESQVRVFVIHTHEEWAIAQDCLKILGEDSSHH
ncbi:acetate kinase [Oscillatoria sp. CS-180]|uniref:acetate/propionate family kinase n=1 Tax=Oscillatoria sp. CS-180 TaxID=3021720 RepID=UPI00232CCFAD|nr:acetate kinase [Oscillatoria sp. CS-180]MDB9529090.1 acetate kinase [Oscillatoria sp. CS-180]